jgi:EutQ-like cupin domain
MAGLSSQNFNAPDETRTFDKGQLAVITLGTATVGRATFQPGWKWSECVKPIAGTESCEAAHLGYVVSGQMHVVMDDGATADTRPGDLVNIAPGHDAWVVGDEPCVMVDFEGASNYAQR